MIVDWLEQSNSCLFVLTTYCQFNSLHTSVVKYYHKINIQQSWGSQLNCAACSICDVDRTFPWYKFWFYEFPFFSPCLRFLFCADILAVTLFGAADKLCRANLISSSCESCFACCAVSRVTVRGSILILLRDTLHTPPLRDWIYAHTHTFIYPRRRNACSNPRSCVCARKQYHLRISSKRLNKWLCTWDVEWNIVKTL